MIEMSGENTQMHASRTGELLALLPSNCNAFADDLLCSWGAKGVKE